MPESVTSTSPGPEMPSPSATSRRLALVVGVNHPTMSESLVELKAAESDAQAIAQVLQQPECGFKLAQQLLIGDQATTPAVKRAVNELCKGRSEDDFLLFYFSGHGLPLNLDERRQDVYLGTADFREAEVKDIGETFHLSLGWIRDMLYLGRRE